METNQFSRRDLLSGIGLTATGGMLAASLGGSMTQADPAPPAINDQALNVCNFGAVGDGVKDDTAAFNAALSAAAKGNFAVFVPAGKYLIGGNLEVPGNVLLEGVFVAPSARTKDSGSILLVTAGAGNVDGDPFILLRTGSTLRGITIYYPNQKMVNPPTPYPWTIRGSGDNITLENLLLVNPYQAIDFGTHAAGRHFINGVYGQPLFRGIFIDQCLDVGRIQNVHFWAFWGGWDGELYDFMRENAEAFVLARSDWEFVSNCFCIGYHTGYHFVDNKHGAGNYLFTQCGSDISPNAVKVDSTQKHSGISFVNCQFMAGIEVAASNSGPVKFTACGFWGVATTDFHARLAGSGHVFFSSCHFVGWGQKDTKAACIHAIHGGLTVTACDFIDLGKAQITVEAEVEAALIYGNRLRGKELIVNHAGARAQIALNLVTAK